MCVRKTITTLAAAGLLAASAALAAWYMVSSCPAPCAEPRDITPIGKGYLVGDGPTPFIYYIDFQTGSVYSSFPAPGGEGACGITEGPGQNTFYLSNYVTSWVYRITTTGSILASYVCPLSAPAGISWGAAKQIELTIPSLNVVAALDAKEGYLISAFRGPGLRPTACLGEHAEYLGDAGTHTVYYRVRSTWYPIITDIETPVGLSAYEYINDTEPSTGLYIVDAATKYIYNYEDNAPVTPASLGKVKALFE
jgi:hypothetical protein